MVSPDIHSASLLSSTVADDERTSKGTHPVLFTRILPLHKRRYLRPPVSGPHKAVGKQGGRWLGVDGEVKARLRLRAASLSFLLHLFFSEFCSDFRNPVKCMAR